MDPKGAEIDLGDDIIGYLRASEISRDRADALEEAGCDDAAILDHLRSPGPHVRGCWALDMLLGKS